MIGGEVKTSALFTSSADFAIKYPIVIKFLNSHSCGEMMVLHKGFQFPEK